MKRHCIFLVLAILFSNTIICAQNKAGNPVFEGWYADPEGIIFDDEYWIYPTMSGVYDKPDKRSRLTKQQIEAQKKKIEWGSQIRSYVLQPYKMVKDVRTSYETGNVNAVLDGDLDGLIKAYLMEFGGE